MELLQEAKDIVGFVPSVEVIKKTLREFVRRRKNSVAAPIPIELKQEILSEGSNALVKQSGKDSPEIKSQSKPQSRYIARDVARAVRERDQYRCSFVSSSGKRCTETCGLEFDHVVPFALGGDSETSNLRLLCHAHNQLAAELVFGRKKIESYFKHPK